MSIPVKVNPSEGFAQTAARQVRVEATAEYLKGRFDRLMQSLLVDAYRVSTQHYWQQQRAAAAYWRTLGDLVEYDTRLMSLSSNDQAPVPVIAVQAAPGRQYRQVKLLVVAKHAGTVYRDTLTIRGLGDTPVLKGLPGIPWVSALRRTGRMASPKGSLYINLLEAVDASGHKFAKLKMPSEIFRPTWTETPPYDLMQRWGQCWSMELMEKDRQRLMNQWYSKLVKPAGQLWRPLTVRRALYGLMTKGPVMSLAFWSRNLICAKRLRASVEPPEGLDPALAAGCRRAGVA
jgi:hypothetical protein